MDVSVLKTALIAMFVCAGLFLSRVSVSTHHSSAAALDEKNRITLTGTVTRVEWVNPHGRIYMDVKGQDGKVTNWAIETAAPSMLSARGLNRSDVPAGAALVVDGYRAGNNATTAVGRIMRLADGTEFLVR